MHAALESLVSDPIPTTDVANVAAEAQSRFDTQLTAQIEQSHSRVRERDQPLDRSRAESAAEAVVAEAIRISRARAARTSPRITAMRLPVEVEVSVRSLDGLLAGVIDLVERDERGVHLVDYKSATRDDLPDRYRRQVQLYAYLWHETRGEWPTSGRVVFSAIGATHAVEVEPEECLMVAEDARRLLECAEATDADPDAQPSDLCATCEYRPWCAPFWQWVGTGDLVERLDHGSMGIEGTVADVKAQPGAVRLALDWLGTPVSVDLAGDRFPHARGVRRGDRVRLLDVRLRGLRSRPTMSITPFSELFVMDGANP